MSNSSKLPSGLIRLGITSLITDSSTESVQPFIPFYLAQLGAGGALIGLVAGICELVVNLLKLCTGWISDQVKRRLPFIWAGYIISPIYKLLLSFTQNLTQASILISLWRSGKGIRTSPRDAYIKQLVPGSYGAAFGFHRAMDTGGALTGAGLALIYLSWGLEYSLIFLIAGLLGFFSLIPLIGLKELGSIQSSADLRAPRPEVYPGSMPKLMLIMGSHGLGYLSVMFFLLRLGQLGVWIPFLGYLGYNAIYAGLAYPAGKLSDRYGRYPMLGLGYGLFCLGCGLTALDPWWGIPGLLSYGASLGFIEGIQRSIVADLSSRPGLGFGIYHSGIGFAILAGNLLAGTLWDLNPAYSFGYGALMSGIGLGGLIWAMSSKPVKS